MPRLRVTGTGTAELPGYGVADAEHRVEKELTAAWPDARLIVLEVRRTDPEPRIVESFALRYSIHGELTVAGEEQAEDRLRRAAFARARAMLAGTRFERVEWEKAVVID